MAVTTGASPSIPERKQKLPIMTRVSEANQATMYVYDSSRIGSSYKRVSVACQLNVREFRPVSYDSVVPYFNSTKATYRFYSVESNNTSLKHGGYYEKKDNEKDGQ